MKHKRAVYYDRNGGRHSINATALEKDVIVELKRYELRDPSEEVELIIVDNTFNAKASHFRIKHAERAVEFYGLSDSDYHDQEVSRLCDKLANCESVNFCFIDFKKSGERNLKTLLKVSNYLFKEEVIRETTVGYPMARYDILGLDDSLSISRKRPEIIIEVVDSNFHDQDLFNFLIEETRNSSLIVIYYFLDAAKYNKYSVNEKELEVRISFYMKGGFVYQCGSRLEVPPHYLREVVDNSYVYYNYIEQTVVKKLKAER